MINDMPTVFEVVTGAAKKQQKEKSSVSNHSSTKSKTNPKPVKVTFLKHIFVLDLIIWQSPYPNLCLVLVFELLVVLIVASNFHLLIDL